MLPKIQAMEALVSINNQWIASSSFDQANIDGKQSALEAITDQAELEETKLTPWQEAVILQSKGVKLMTAPPPDVNQLKGS